jgi:hypothetical protein
MQWTTFAIPLGPFNNGSAQRSSPENPYAVLPALTAQRVQRATQLANDLCLDLQTVEVTAETEGVGDLYRAVDDLRRRLDLLFKREV